MNFDMVEAYRKWMGDLRDAQRPNGQLPGVAPTPGWGYNWGTGPGYDSAMIHIPHHVWKLANEDSLARENWSHMKRLMEFMDSMSEDFICDYGLHDWLPPKGSKPCPSAVTGTAFYFSCAKMMGEMAEELKETEDKLRFKELSKNIRLSFRKNFIKGGIVGDGGQTALACAVYYGLLDSDELPAAAQRLAHLVECCGFHITCGTFGAKAIFSALSDYGYADVAYRMAVNPKPPSYAHWILNGLTTLPEEWEMGNSLFHTAFTEIDMWLYKHVAGVRLDAGSIAIKPCFLKGLEWTKARHKDICVEWSKKELTVTLPRPALIDVEGAVYQRGAGRWSFERKCKHV
jgi:alpha-L-rhamnosidase